MYDGRVEGPNTVPAALPKQQRWCVVVVVLIGKQQARVVTTTIRPQLTEIDTADSRGFSRGS